MLTKSLHTITAVANVARFLHSQLELKGSANANQLTLAALKILGYADVSVPNPSDETVTRCVAAVGKILAERKS